MSTNPKQKHLAGFTLLEVVLAIGLTGVVLALLTTAIDLYLVRVDVSRTRVESAQLARTLLTRMADDLRAARYWSPSSDSTSSSNTGDTSTGDTDTEASAKVLGIFGTATELRIDRGARWNWERTTQEIDATSETAADEMPQTVQYVFNSGNTLLASRMAALGVLADPALPGYAGLYRQQAATAAWIYQTSATGVSVSATEQSAPELLAPEVLELEFKYFDGQQLLEQWDSAQQGRLPRGIEIHLTVLEEPFELAMIQSSQERDAQLHSKENAVQYRLYVRLPNVRPRQLPRQDAARGSKGGSSDDSSSG